MSALSTSSSHNDAAKLKVEGNKLFHAKKYKAAAEKYRGAIEKHPSFPIYTQTYVLVSTILSFTRRWK